MCQVGLCCPFRVQTISEFKRGAIGFEETVVAPAPRDALEPKLPPQSRLAAMFTVSATMIVLNKKPIKPCTVASLRSFREEICTSDT